MDAVGLVGDEEVEHGPDEGEAARLPGEPAHHLGAAFHLAERPFEQVGAAPSSAMAQRVAQVHHQRVEIVGQAPCRGGEPVAVELVDERLESLLGVLFADRLLQRPPVGVLDPSRSRSGSLA